MKSMFYDFSPKLIARANVPFMAFEAPQLSRDVQAGEGDKFSMLRDTLQNFYTACCK